MSYWLGEKQLTKSSWNDSGMTKHVDLTKSVLRIRVALMMFIGWIHSLKYSKKYTKYYLE